MTTVITNAISPWQHILLTTPFEIYIFFCNSNILKARPKCILMAVFLKNSISRNFESVYLEKCRTTQQASSMKIRRQIFHIYFFVIIFIFDFLTFGIFVRHYTLWFSHPTYFYYEYNEQDFVAIKRTWRKYRHYCRAKGLTATTIKLYWRSTYS